MSSFRDEVRAIVDQLEAAGASMDLNLPSGVLVTDPHTNTKGFHGPYPDGYAAFDAAEALRKHGGFPPECVFEVVPFYTPEREWS